MIAGICAGTESIDDLEVVRSAGMKTLFDGVSAPSNVGTLLREFTFGHARQLDAVLGGALARVFVDIDSLLRPVYGHAQPGVSYGHSKIAGKPVLRMGLSRLAATISTAESAPVIAGMRLRAGRAGSGKGPGRIIAQAICTARAAGATGTILVRGDSAYGTRAVVGVCMRQNAQFSLLMARKKAVQRANAAILEAAWTPVDYPGEIRDPDTGAWISDAEVAETSYLGAVRGDRPQPVARPESSPAAPTALLVARHCAGASSTSPPDWPARNDAPFCTCHPLALACAVAEDDGIQPTANRGPLTTRRRASASEDPASQAANCGIAVGDLRSYPRFRALGEAQRAVDHARTDNGG